MGESRSITKIAILSNYQCNYNALKVHTFQLLGISYRKEKDCFHNINFLVIFFQVILQLYKSYRLKKNAIGCFIQVLSFYSLLNH